MDDVIFEEFKGTAIRSCACPARLADRRLYPAVDVAASGTRREELLADPPTVAAKQQLRGAWSGSTGEGDRHPAGAAAARQDQRRAARRRQLAVSFRADDAL